MSAQSLGRPAYNLRGSLKLYRKDGNGLIGINPVGKTSSQVNMSSPGSATYDVFLSYSARDHKEAEAIQTAVDEAGGKVFFAPKDQKPGADFSESLRAALRCSTELWILISPNSLKSEWVSREIGAAWGLNLRIVPILFRCSPEQMPPDLSRIHAVDYHEVREYIAAKFANRQTEMHPEDRRLVEDFVARGQIIQAVSVGQRHLFAGRFAESLRLFELIQDIAPQTHFDYYIVLGNMAYSLIGLGREAEALDLLVQVRSAHNGDTYFPWHAFASAAANLRLGRKELAEEDVTEALAPPRCDEKEIASAISRYPDLKPLIEAAKAESQKLS